MAGARLWNVPPIISDCFKLLKYYVSVDGSVVNSLNGKIQAMNKILVISSIYWFKFTKRIPCPNHWRSLNYSMSSKRWASRLISSPALSLRLWHLELSHTRLSSDNSLSLQSSSPSRTPFPQNDMNLIFYNRVSLLLLQGPRIKDACAIKAKINLKRLHFDSIYSVNGEMAWHNAVKLKEDPSSVKLLGEVFS